LTNGSAQQRRRGAAPAAPAPRSPDPKKPLLADFFRQFAHRSSTLFGSPWAFIAATLLIIGWAATGPFFNFSDTWQLVINTGTTVVTFLMVFLIQSTQNRDAKALHLKLDELIRALGPARNRLLDLEEMSDEELRALEREFKKLRDRAALAAAEAEEAQAVTSETRRGKKTS
jgi:low affinity Fe/Cu permease